MLQEGTFPIHCAANFGQTEMVELLVDEYGIGPAVKSDVCNHKLYANDLCSSCNHISLVPRVSPMHFKGKPGHEANIRYYHSTVDMCSL